MKRMTFVLLVAGCGVDIGRPDGGPGAEPDLTASTGPQGCQGLQCQIVSCPTGTDTTVTGRIFAPNGKDPVPGAQVYVPNMGLPEFPSTVSCDLCSDVQGAAANAQTTFDGRFTMTHVPAGQQIPIVIQLGRFRRVLHVDLTQCIGTTLTADAGSTGTRLPHKDAELDPADTVPHIAVATGDYDQIECVLKRMGLQQFDLYGDRDPGAPPATVGTFASLLADSTKLQSYNILVVNCTNNQFDSALFQKNALGNLHDFVGMGGRLYATDWAYDVIDQVTEFSPYLCFEPQNGAAMQCGGGALSPMAADTTNPYSGPATIKDPGLLTWLGQFPGVLSGNKVEVDYSFVAVNQVAADTKNYPTTTWVEGMTNDFGVKPMTVTFDYMGCGRVHYSTYNTEPNGVVPDNERFPNCKADFSPQERILEYLVFEIASCVGVG